jgi:histidinol dehydrogenase
MAYGTESIEKCNVIVGPGNKYVAEAKRQIFGSCGIDMVAGPTEAFIIADESANSAWVAADMLAQAEHDPEAQVTLVCASEQMARAVWLEAKTQTEKLATEATINTSLTRNAVIIVAENLRDAIPLANRKAPEHLELAMANTKDRAYFVDHLQNYGSLFIGHLSAEVLGDYSAGLNHTLPTDGAARYTGGLSPRAFLKTVTTLRSENGTGTDRSLDAAFRMGTAEGLVAHAEAAHIRMQEQNRI